MEIFCHIKIPSENLGDASKLINLYLVEKDEKLKNKSEQNIKVSYPLDLRLISFKLLKRDRKSYSETEWQKIQNLYSQKQSKVLQVPNRKIGDYFVVEQDRKINLKLTQKLPLMMKNLEYCMKQINYL